MFYELQKANYKKFRVENITKAKVSKIYVKWKGHNNSFKNWIDKKSRMGMESNSLCKQNKTKKNKKTKTDLKIAKGVDTSLLKRNNLANLMLIN